MPAALSIRIKVRKPDKDPAQPRYLGAPILVLRASVDPPAEIDGMFVPFQLRWYLDL